MLLLLAGCAPADTATPPGSPAAAASPADASPSLAPGEFLNPVLDRDFPDPGVLAADGTFYAYATEGGGRHIQVASSTDLVTWEYLGEALPTLPRWTTGSTWAPEVVQTPAGFVMYYTARHPATVRPDGQGSQCITLAVATEPQGPFVDDSEGPFICQADLGGSIDAFPYRAPDGALYLVWKNDGNCCSRITRMWAQPLSVDGLELIGEPVDLGIANDNAWERHVIEAPTILLRDGTYYLFFSANDYASDQYAVGYATATALLGPYADADENPILATPGDPANRAFGPGGQAIVTGIDGGDWMLYHAWDGLFRERSMWLDRVTWQEGRPLVEGPTSVPQAVP
jgi:beta-xylosidase